MLNTHLEPVVNGCYLDIGGEMFKVKLLHYKDSKLDVVVLEDTLGYIHHMGIEFWRSSQFIPMCLSWNADQSANACYENEAKQREQA